MMMDIIFCAMMAHSKMNAYFLTILALLVAFFYLLCADVTIEAFFLGIYLLLFRFLGYLFYIGRPQ